MANISGKRKIEPFFVLVFFCRLQKALLFASLIREAGRQLADLTRSLQFVWFDVMISIPRFSSLFFSFIFPLSLFFDCISWSNCSQISGFFFWLSVVVSLIQSVSPSASALSLHCRPSAFCVIGQRQQQKLLLLVSFCWTTAYDLSFSFILCAKSLLNSLSVRPSELRLAVVKDTTIPFLNFSCCCLRLMVFALWPLDSHLLARKFLLPQKDYSSSAHQDLFRRHHRALSPGSRSYRSLQDSHRSGGTNSLCISLDCSLRFSPVDEHSVL